MSQTNRLFSRSFVALSAIQFLAFCNVAVFFPFYSYLRTLPIDPHWLGFLIGAYALSAVVVRPVISPLLHLGNARRWMFFSSIGFIGALPLYSLADGFWTMLAVRTLHGAFHAGLVSAMLAMVVAFIPKEKSGQAFALLSVNTLLPYAIIPPILGPLQHMLGGFEHVLTAGAVVMLLCFPLLLFVKIPVQDADTAGDCHQRMTMVDIGENLRNSKLLTLLVITLLLYSSFTPVFFFIKGYGDSIGIRTPGLFFTVATLTMIGLRVGAGSFFDRFNKALLMALSLAWLMVGYTALAFAFGPVSFYILAGALGLGWGVGMPVLNAMIFECSEPRFSGLNINLAQETLQIGFLLGPLVAGWIISDSDYRTLFYMCSLFCLVALALAPLTLVGSKSK